jgi:hypothetical protein
MELAKCACVRACVRVCVRACVRACVRNVASNNVKGFKSSNVALRTTNDTYETAV